MANTSYAPKLPLEVNNQDNFTYIKDALGNIKQKLKMIVLTSKGEKIYEPDFGLGIRNYLFEPSTGLLTVSNNPSDNSKVITSSDFQQHINTELLKQVDKYSPDILIKDCIAEITDKTIYLSIKYSYRGFMEDNLEILINI